MELIHRHTVHSLNFFFFWELTHGRYITHCLGSAAAKKSGKFGGEGLGLCDFLKYIHPFFFFPSIEHIWMHYN